VCSLLFAQTTTYDATKGERIWASEKRKRKIRFQNHFWLSSLLLFFFPQFFPSLSPSPRRRLFLLCILRGGRGRERDAGTTENASVTDDSEQSSDDE
jgi:hypothetical protein